MSSGSQDPDLVSLTPAEEPDIVPLTAEPEIPLVHADGLRRQYQGVCRTPARDAYERGRLKELASGLEQVRERRGLAAYQAERRRVLSDWSKAQPSPVFIQWLRDQINEEPVCIDRLTPEHVSAGSGWMLMEHGERGVALRVMSAEEFILLSSHRPTEPAQAESCLMACSLLPWTADVPLAMQSFVGYLQRRLEESDARRPQRPFVISGEGWEVSYTREEGFTLRRPPVPAAAEDWPTTIDPLSLTARDRIIDLAKRHVGHPPQSPDAMRATHLLLGLLRQVPALQAPVGWAYPPSDIIDGPAFQLIVSGPYLRLVVR